jgi:hypothetical protein
MTALTRDAVVMVERLAQVESERDAVQRQLEEAVRQHTLAGDEKTQALTTQIEKVCMRM